MNRLPIRLELTPSKGYAGLLLLAHGLAAACLLAILTGWQAIALAVLVAMGPCLAGLGGFAARHRPPRLGQGPLPARYR